MQNPPESNRQPADYFGNRWIITGGSNGILYGLLLLGAILTLNRNRRLDLREVDRSDSYLASLQARLMLSFVVTIFLPQTLELRYYLFNLYVPCFVAVSSPWRQLRWAMQGLAGLGVAFGLISTIVLPFYFWTKTHVWLHDRVSWDLFYQRPSSEECARIDAIIRGSDSNRQHDISIVKASVLCNF
mgnify:CR=1 FL=1